MSPKQKNKRELLARLLQRKMTIKAEMRPVEKYSDDTIAIVGLSGRYPMAENLDIFWDNLLAGKDCISDIPEVRWKWSDFLDGESENQSKRKGGFITDVDKFDPQFFGISPREAIVMDPQERLFLQAAWHTIEDAGYTPKSLVNSSGKVGVFVGVMNSNYSILGSSIWPETQKTEQNFICNALFWSIANRVSYCLNFNGPSLAVDTACSSSLTAIHLACESIKRNECEAAIAGGVNLILHPAQLDILAKKGMLSQTGKCNSFGKGADGFVDGEGVGAILLKPLNQALQDGDNIYGIVRGSSINSGGKTSGYTVPNPNAQADLISTVLEQTKIDPRSISYMEAHGTGTALGDPIEIRGLTKAFSSYTVDRQFCALGSVKANIGHLEAAAGISGITKILLQMKHNFIVPTINSEYESEFINLKNSPFYLQKEKSVWESENNKIAGISSFGAGGSNAHIILQSLEIPERKYKDTACLIPISVMHPQQLPGYIESLVNTIERNRKTRHFNLINLSHTLIVGRQSMAVRLALVVENFDELITKCRQYLQGDRNIAGLFEEQVDLDNIKEKATPEFLQNDSLVSLAKKWVQGEIEKPLPLLKEFSPQRISLPGYPFLKERYWVPVTQKTTIASINTSPSIALTREVTPQLNEESNLVGNMYLEPSWVNRPLVSGTPSHNVNNIMIFKDHINDYSLIEQHFAHVTFVKPGDSFSKIEHNCYSVSQDKKEDLELLLTAVGNHQPIDTIIYAWPGSAINGSFDTAETLYGGIQPLLNLTKLLVARHRNQPVKLIIWSIDNGSLADLSSLAYAGFIKSIKAEQKNIFAKHIIFEKNEDHALEFQLSALANELSQPSSEPAIVKYCEKQRKVENIKSIGVPPQMELRDSFKPGGGYLITGGLGGLGKVFAKHIASIGGVKLVLTGRSLLSESNKAFIDELKDNNNEVIYYACDITSEVDSHTLFEKIKNRAIQLNGIIHSAGVIKDCLVNRKSWLDFKTVIDTKIKGIINLDQESATIPLDFFVAFSSVSSVLGNAGQTDYAYGNTYLDDFCRWRNTLKNKNLRSGKSISINWPIWEEGGMQIDQNLLKAMQQSVGIIPLSANEGIKVFDNIMNLSSTQVVPLHGVLARLEKILEKFNSSYDEPAGDTCFTEQFPIPPASPKIELPTGRLLRPLENKLRDMIASAIQLPKERINPNQVFGDLGFDSITLREFAANFKTILGVDLSPTIFFSCNTLNKMLHYLMTEHLPSIENALGLSGSTVADYPAPATLQNAAVSQRHHVPSIDHSSDRSQAESRHTDPVAIIGMDGIFPGAENLDVFWDNLSNSIDPIMEIPEQRWRWQDYYGSTFGAANKMNSKWGGFMPHIDHFDYSFFDIPENEAIHMDPQQRLFLQTVWKTIESAGYDAVKLKGDRVGVFVGVEFSDYKDYLDHNGIRYNAEVAIGNSLNMIPNRISYYFDFEGPSEAIDTACSGSLVAINRAIRSIQSGESSLAIAGGVSLTLSPKTMVGTSQLNIYSPDGRCKTFDKNANGYVKGEGVGVILLKPLRAALNDGDNILAVIKGSAVNHGGRSNSITAPNPVAQARLLFNAYREAGVDAERISYIEMHGTGTNLGDPVEIEGIKNAFKMLSEFTQKPISKEHYCGIGSVKSNIGHLEPASGVAGVIKVILAMKAHQLPPNLHFKELNPLIKIEHTPFYIVDKKQEWKRFQDEDGRELPLIAGVSSFGFGGTNAHIVLEEWIPAEQHISVDEPFAFVLSAKTPRQLDEYIRSIVNYIETAKHQSVSLRSFIYTLQVGRHPMAERFAIAVNHWQDLLYKLHDYLAGKLPAADCRGSRDANNIPIRDLLDESLQNYILQSGNTTQLTRWWLLGVDFDWRLLYVNVPTQRVNLPTYPFAKTHCWIDSIPAENVLVLPEPLSKPFEPEKKPAVASVNIPAAIIEKIARLAGVSAEKITNDSHLTADIGLDSIKMMSLVNELISSRPDSEMEYYNALGMTAIVSQAQTVSGLINIFQQAQESASTIEDVVSQGQDILQAQANRHNEDVPLLDSQSLFLPTYFITNSSSLASSVEIKGELDIGIANIAWRKLIERHPVLQLTFKWPSQKSATFANVKVSFVEKLTTPQLQCFDISHLSDKDAEIEKAFTDRLNYKWDLETWPLHDFAAYKKSANEYVLFWSNEHIISDGLSNQQALREFLELYAHEIQGTSMPAATVNTREAYINLVNRINQYVERDVVDYSPQAAIGSYCFNPDGKQRDINTARFACVKKVIDKATTLKLMDLTKRLRFSINTIITNAFIKVISQHDKSDNDIILQIPTGGRNYPNLTFTDTMGCFAQNLSIRFPRTQDIDQQVSFENVQNTINDSILYGVDIKQAKELGILVRQMPLTENNTLPKHAADMMLGSVKSNLYFPYTGHTGINEHYGNISILQYTAGTSNSPGSIDLLQEIFADQLHIFVNYDATFFSAALIDNLIADYIAVLESFIDMTAASHTELNVTATSRQIDTVLHQANAILNADLTLADIEKDLEADLGFDSIDKIKFVTQLYTQNKAINRSTLIKCRSLAEMASSIESNITKNTSVVPFSPIKPEPAFFERQQDVFASEFLTPIERIIYQAKMTPDAIAVTNQHGSVITYQELHYQSNQIAHILKAKGIGPSDFVGVLSNRGPLMLVGILAILKTGAAYVPIDPSYPVGRMHYILNHANIKTVVADPDLIHVFDELFPLEKEQGVEDSSLESIILLKNETAAQLAGFKHIISDVITTKDWCLGSLDDVHTVINPLDNMVVLFTSGSTGNPKGVVLNHEGYNNRLNWHQKMFGLLPGEKVAQKTSCCFDVSLWELFWPLMFGGIVCAVEKETVSNPWDFADWLESEAINIAHFVPSMFGAFISSIDTGKHRFPSLRWLAFSGEALATNTVQDWIDHYQFNVGLCNLYGPTEASIDVTYHVIDKRPEDAEPIPIGKAIDNVYLLVLDENGNKVDRGVKGELCIGGIQVAKEYLFEPVLTAKAFIPNQYAAIPGNTLYRTGDLAIENDDGSFNYHGRIDNQVKIRGFRVELGEIENIASSHKNIQEAAVLLVNQGGTDKLVLWYSGQQTNESDIKSLINAHCPDYMVPHFVYRLDSLPKNSNGKLDRKALLHQLQAAGKHNTVTDKKIIASPAVLPIGPAQKWIFSYFDEPYSWFGVSQLHYRKSLNVDCFQQAINILVRQYAELRTIFSKENEIWVQHIYEDCPSLEIIQCDSAGDNIVKDHMQQLAYEIAESLHCDQWPLCKFALLKLSDGTHQILWVAHHLISDLVSGQILTEKLWSIYNGLVNGSREPHTVSLPSTSYASYIKTLQDLYPDEQLEQCVNFWKKQAGSAKKRLDVPFDHQQGENVENSNDRLIFTLDKAAVDFLHRKASSFYNCNFYPLLCAPVYRLMSTLLRRSWVVISHKLNARNIGDAAHNYFDCIGNFAVNAPLGMTIKKQDKYSVIVSAIKDGLSDMPMGGASYDWVAEKLPKDIYPDNKLTSVRINYLGDITPIVTDEFDTDAEEINQRLSFAHQKRTSLLEFFFYTKNKTTFLEISYSRNFYEAKTIENLALRYLNNLDELIDDVKFESAVAITEVEE